MAAPAPFYKVKVLYASYILSYTGLDNWITGATHQNTEGKNRLQILKDEGLYLIFQKYFNLNFSVIYVTFSFCKILQIFVIFVDRPTFIFQIQWKNKNFRLYFTFQK